MEIKDTSIHVSGGPSSESLVALARAAEANAEAIKAIAENMKATAPTYGIYIAAAPQTKRSK